MLDGLMDLFKSSQAAKLKSLIKLLKIRLEAIRKKRSSMLKYFKNDIADLLRGGLDYNAYVRAEGLLVEMNMSSCYHMIEQFCGTVSNHISSMDKQRECPEECREAISSLMHGAARFADLPELRDLRTIFTHRYGDSLQVFVCKEFVQKLRAEPPEKETKFQLMQEIAQQYSIDWDFKALEQKLYAPSSHEQDCKSKDDKDATISKGNKDNLVSHVHKEVSDDKHILNKYSEKEDVSSPEPSNSGNVVPEEKAEKKPFYYRLIPPPYLKSRAVQPFSYETDDAITNNQTRSDLPPKDQETDRPNDLPGEDERLKSPRSVRRRSSKSQPDLNDSFDAPPNRARSLPQQPTSPTEAAARGPFRAASMEPETSGHVHPRLPDFDDLAARVAALSGK